MGRYTLTATSAELAARFDVPPPDEYGPRYNCAPGQRLPVVTADADRMRRLQWGFVPTWADDESTSFINARAETVRDKASFAAAFEQRRCLVPMDGVYEWRTEEGHRRPYRLVTEADGPFAVAGIWTRYEPETVQTGLDAFGGGAGAEQPGDSIETFAILTTAATGLPARFQDRMDVLVSPTDEETWLSGSPAAAAAVLESPPTPWLRAYPVSDAVNDPGNQDPSLIEPIGPDLEAA
jgi:putative SOS response-associated peptidase YedK